ncbi:PREDICTED: putative disease resistance protein At4g19050 [Theobroma cacao]|uniref:Disease resistance protein At4g19050 n=1 Tax=Theobroma cacao TaxID=3641 RepID=A0AB32W4M5_THECC|nr:PREDICTED: putative disease resistance protein At4g19050 [Theobroma cacao]
MEFTSAKAKVDDAEKIHNLLEKGNEERVVLAGDAGTGKTWLARQISKFATGATGSFYMSLWISLNEKFDDYGSLLHSLARQLRIPTSANANVWEDVEYADDADDTDDEKKDVDDYRLRVKVMGKLYEKNREMSEKMRKEESEAKHTCLLLVLDSEGVVMTEDYDDFVKKLFHSDENVKTEDEASFKHKVLITTRKSEEEGSITKDSRVVEVQPFSGDEAVIFLENRVREEVSRVPNFEIFRVAIKERSEVLPAQINMLTEALNQIAKDGPEALRRAFDIAALNILRRADKADKGLVHFAYENLSGDCLIDCFWHSCYFLEKHGAVNYNELITHWILEGHLDLAVGLKKAYEKGYNVMMELIDRGMLKMREPNLIVLEVGTLRLEDHSCRGLFGKSKLGLASVLEGDNKKVFERMAPADGMIKTVRTDQEGKTVSSLLIEGSYLCREVPDTFFQEKEHLKVLAIFNPRLTSLPKSISKMENLLVLVLRDCHLLNDNMECIENLKALIVLEISGAPFLKELSEVLFTNMNQLRSLNLSALRIKSLPASLSNLTELRRLILRQCSCLETLPKLAKLKNLEVIDLSGCSSLIKIQEKSFKSFEKLRVIDFSETKIEKLPIVQTLKHLTLLLAKGCDHLSGLRLMKHLPDLKVLDVSGATRIKEIQYDSFEGTDNLRILDLSKTDIRFLPDSLGKHLCDLKLKGCSKLEKLPSTRALTDLESLDLSEDSSLQKFPDRFFENLSSLQSLNLSHTKVKSLPALPNLHNLQRLFLKGCLFENLPELKELTGLVELDLSGCESLVNLPSLADLKYLEIINLSSCKSLSGIDKYFQHMSWLQVLNVSETQIPSFPSLPNPSKLRSLILRNCTKLEESPDFQILVELEQLDLRGTSSLKDIKAESFNQLAQLRTLKLSKIALKGMQSSLSALTELQVLDLSAEAVESLPSLGGLSKLRQLLLRGCSSLKELPSLNSGLEVLDLSGTKVKNLGEKISKLTNLKRLHLPEKVIEEFKGENVKFLPLEVNLDRCCISEPSEIPKGGEKPSMVVHGTELLQSLKKDPTLLESISSISSVHSVKTHGRDEDNYDDSRRQIFSDIYSMIRKLPLEAKDGQFLEIRGFDDYPIDIEFVLEHAKYIMLVENQFLKNLSDLKPDSLKNMKGCWLERCSGMESIFAKADLEMEKPLEILWISNLPSLKSLYQEEVQSLSSGNLKILYIDCCPTLETVFSSGQLPENLETLQIMFCDNLKNLFGAKDSAKSEPQTTSSADKEVDTTSSTKKEVQTTSAADKLPAKKEVQTKSSADKVSAKREVQSTTSTDKEVQTTSSADKEAQTTISSDKEVQPTSSADKEVQTTATAKKDVQTMSSTDKQLQTMISAEKEVQTTSRSNLKHLHISHCPMLETVFSSAQLPKRLEILRIKCCGKLKSFSGQELINLELPNLHTLHLLELPAWTASSISLKSNKSIPNVEVSPNIPVEKSLRSGNASKEITGADKN